MGDDEAIILLVDDNEDDLELLRKSVRSVPCLVKCASGGDEALRMLTGRCRVMITDLHMPTMNGLDLAREARGIVPHLTVILCTGDDPERVREAAREAGIAAVYGKPLNLREVLSLVSAEMEKSKTST